MPYFTACYLLLFLATSSLLQAAEPVSIVDPSLETVFEGKLEEPNSGWLTFSSSGAAQATDGSGFFGSFKNAHGSSAAYAASHSPSDGDAIYQAVHLQAAHSYQLSVNVAQSKVVHKNDGLFALVFADPTSLKPLKKQSGTVKNQVNNFTTHSVEFTPTTSGVYLIGLRNMGYLKGTGDKTQSSTIFFDHIRLTDLTQSSTTSAPITTTLIGIGGISISLQSTDLTPQQ